MYFPVKLLLTIHGIEITPATIDQTNESIIIVELDENLIEKKNITRIKAANRHPEYLPDYPLLHTNHHLTFKILPENFDTNQEITKTLIAILSINLNDFPTDGTIIRKKYSISSTNSVQFILDLSIVLLRNDVITFIKSSEVKTWNPKDTPQTEKTDRKEKEKEEEREVEEEQPHEKDEPRQSQLLSALFLQNIELENIWETTSKVIQTSLCSWLSEEGEQLSPHLLTVPFIYDLLLESRVFLSQPENAIDTYLPNNISENLVRKQLKLHNSSEILLSQSNLKQTILLTPTVIKHFPIEELSLQIQFSNLTEQKKQMISLTFANRFSLWNWMKWIQLAFNYWHKLLKEEDLPSWASTGKLHSTVTVNQSDCLTGFKRKILLDLKRDFALTLDNEETVSLVNMSSVVLSADSIVPSEYFLELQLSENTLFAFQQHGLDGLNLHSTSEENHHPKKKKTLTKTFSVKKVFKAISTVTQLGMNQKKEHATKDGNQKEILAFVTVRKGGEVYRFPLSTIEEMEIHEIDVDLADISEDDIDENDPSTKVECIPKSLLPEEHPQPLTFDVTLFHMDSAELTIDGQKAQKVKRLIQKNKNNESILDNLRGMNQNSTLTDPNDCVISLISRIGYTFTLISANDLMIPSVDVDGKENNYGIFAKCSFAGLNGQSFNADHIENNSQTPIILLSTVRQWNHTITLFLDHSTQTEKEQHYLRIELFWTEIANEAYTEMKYSNLGVAFLPLNYFTIRENQYSLPLTRIGESSSSTAHRQPDRSNSNQSQQGETFGEVVIRCQKIEEVVNHSQQNYQIEVQSILKEVTLFNTSWYAEIVPVSEVHFTNITAERAYVTILPDGLQLNEEEPRPYTDHHSEYSVSIDSDRETEAWPRANQVFTIKNAEFLVEIFENDRRAPYPPFDWANSAYTRARYSDWTFERNYKFETLANAAPPDGADWVGEWTLDVTHAKTDPNGWIYGFTFGLIISNYAKGVTYTSPNNCHTRRRKWFRKARLRDADVSIEDIDVMISFGKNLKDVTAPVEDHKERGAEKEHCPDQKGISPKGIHLPFWRKMVAKKRRDSILATCSEKMDETSAIGINWKEVKDTTVITPSILSVILIVNRYSLEKDSFCPIEVELFISNCFAIELKDFIEERISFTRIKTFIRQVVQSGNVFGLSQSSFAANFSTLTEEELTNTEKVNIGSEIIRTLDSQLVTFQQRLLRLHLNFPTSLPVDQRRYQTEKRALERRIIRLRLYIAGLCSLSLQGIHSYEKQEIRQMLFADFSRAQKIHADDEKRGSEGGGAADTTGKTAKKRIEYLFEMAERRIRDAALCGWRFQEDGSLEQCIEIFMNGYLIEIVGLIAKVFQSVINNLDGQSAEEVQPFIDILQFYFQKNDHLNLTIQNVFKPYALNTNVEVKFSLFLPFEIVNEWYGVILKKATGSMVENLFTTWRKSTERLKEGSLAQTMQENNGVLIASHFPEEIAKSLLQYLLFVGVNPEFAVSFAPLFPSIDLKISLSYTNAFLFLANAYLLVLDEREWFQYTKKEELADYARWVCCIHSDAGRISSNQLFDSFKAKTTTEPNQQQLDQQLNEDTKLILCQARQSFERVEAETINRLVSLLFLEKKAIFEEREVFIEKWKESTTDLFADSFLSIEKYLPLYKAKLNTNSLSLLIDQFSLKMIGLFLSLLSSLHWYGEVCERDEHPLLARLAEESQLIAEKINSLSRMYPNSDEKGPLKEIADENVFLFERLPILLKEELSSRSMSQTLQELITVGKKSSKEVSTSIINGVQVILSLRGVSAYFSPKQEELSSHNREQSIKNQFELFFKSLATNQQVIESPTNLHHHQTNNIDACIHYSHPFSTIFYQQHQENVFLLKEFLFFIK